MENRPQGREKHVTGAGKDIRKQGEGLHSGPVGQSSSSAGRRPTGSPAGQRPAGSPAGQRPAGSPRQRAYPATGAGAGPTGRRSPIVGIIIAVIALLGGGGFGLSSLLGGGGAEAPSSGYVSDYTPSHTQAPSSGGSQSSLGGLGGLGQSLDISSLLGGSVGSVSSGWSGSSNTQKLNTAVDPAARPKYTKLLGGGQDTVTIMVYMCGSDLESKSGMASSDLQEMTNAALGDQVNLIVYTGGSTTWKNSVVSSSVNQIYQVVSGGLIPLVKDDGADPMTRPATLRRFIEFCAEKYPANRNELILWDHGGGSISGYGYDEKNPRNGSMALSGLNEALTGAGVRFDFIGFDACLMGTLETGLSLAPHADYLIASEETEPGIGWYYTDWLTALSADTSMPTVEIGKRIVDDFVATCDRRCAGQKTTLSVVDLAELEKTVPGKFSDFAQSLSGLLEEKEFKAVSDARANTREFAVSSKVDQVDLVHLSRNLGTPESRALADTILSAVKYNRTSSSITDAYGLSIYFPYQKRDRVDSAVNAYNALGLDSEYSRCIRQFASVQGAGQAVSGSSGSPMGSLLGGGSGSLPTGDLFSGLLNSFLSGGGSFGLTDRGLSADALADYLKDSRFDPAELVWQQTGSGYAMRLSEKQWSLVHDLALSVFYDDGEGFLDLGLDNVFEFTEDGALLGDYDGTWLAIDGQPVAYYYLDTVYEEDSYTVTGRVPVLLNGSRADLILLFDNARPYGVIAGARSDYRDGETETVAKSIPELEIGDRIEFLCDYYAYDGTYLDSYRISDPVTYTGQEEISNVYIDAEAASACYLFTDVYNQSYWTPVIP